MFIFWTDMAKAWLVSHIYLLG